MARKAPFGNRHLERHPEKIDENPDCEATYEKAQKRHRDNGYPVRQRWINSGEDYQKPGEE